MNTERCLARPWASANQVGPTGNQAPMEYLIKTFDAGEQRGSWEWGILIYWIATGLMERPLLRTKRSSWQEIQSTD